MRFVLLIAVLIFSEEAFSLKGPFYEPQIWPNRTGIVHLFEWKWQDIARECEEFLAPRGFAAVQVSPPTENIIVRRESRSRPWWERYQPISYHLSTRSGNEAEFEDMSLRCNRVGIRIYIDLVVNHMTGNADSALGTDGSPANTTDMSYPAVPFSKDHFHKPKCAINDFRNAVEVRDCELVGLHDLDQSQPYVRRKIVDLMNRLIDLGVAGFRVDAAKHMWPNDIFVIMEGMKPLNTTYGFAVNAKPFVYQEVIDNGGEPITYNDYSYIGRVIDFKYSAAISRVFRGDDQLRWLRNWGPEWNLVYGPISVVFVDNHDNQREHDGNGPILNYKRSKKYKMAVAFMLAHHHGFPRIMSSYHFDDFNQGPPMNAKEELISPAFGPDGECTNGYVCEHRWRQIYNMIAFKNIAGDTPIQNWWDNGGNQIAFSRGNNAFIAFNNENRAMNETLVTGLPEGTYCDVISGRIDDSGRGCTGKELIVASDMKATIDISPEEHDGVVAIHIGAKAG